MSLSPTTVAAGQPVTKSIMGDSYDAEIASVSATGKTITLASGSVARWNAKKSRFQIGKACSRGYAITVGERREAKLDPHH